MSVSVGEFASVQIHGNIVAEMGIYQLTGFTRKTLDKTSLNQDIESYVFGVASGGEININGNYDPTDSVGQSILDRFVNNGEYLYTGEFRLYIDDTSYFTVHDNGSMLITENSSVKFDKAGIGVVDFLVKVSGDYIFVGNTPLYDINSEASDDLQSEDSKTLITNQ